MIALINRSDINNIGYAFDVIWCHIVQDFPVALHKDYLQEMTSR